MASKRTKALKVSERTYNTIKMRDNGECLFCKMKYHLPKSSQDMQRFIFDAAHYINRSKGGLGIEENLIYLCRHHHHLLDNGNKGLRPIMLDMIKAYLSNYYEKWHKDMLIYDKYADYEEKEPLTVNMDDINIDSNEIIE